MERLNSEGIPRSQLLYALGNRKIVENARKVGQCMLCCRSNVNEAGLCQWCYASLDNPELQAAVKWTSGIGP
ncbi:MAG: hypothetical protein JST51_17760 [Armatimonadetes bacterium]|nr:hypothetical protein [Armatimonadota bacterium]